MSIRRPDISTDWLKGAEDEMDRAKEQMEEAEYKYFKAVAVYALIKEESVRKVLEEEGIIPGVHVYVCLCEDKGGGIYIYEGIVEGWNAELRLRMRYLSTRGKPLKTTVSFDIDTRLEKH